MSSGRNRPEIRGWNTAGPPRFFWLVSVVFAVAGAIAAYVAITEAAGRGTSIAVVVFGAESALLFGLAALALLPYRKDRR
jgi:hypothetical protein